MESVKRYNQTRIRYATDELADKAFVDAEDFDRVSAENLALQQRLTVQDQRVDDQKQRIASLVGKTTQCKACGSDDLFWYSHIHNHSTVQVNRLNTNDVTCLLILGCNNCSETLMTVSADKLAEHMTAALNPTAEAESHNTRKADFVRLNSAEHCPECGHPDCNGQCYGDDMMGDS